MERYGEVYEARYSATFLEKKASKKYRGLRDTIEKKCNLILQAPRGACKSERLKYEYRGKRSGRVDDTSRIIYTICEECYEAGDQEQNLMDCPNCPKVPLKTVNFLDIIDYH